jgi:tetratricopeptide (TPR) repeat protein
VEFSRENTGKRWAILCVAIVLSAVMIYQAGELALAWYWSRSSNLARRIRGAELVPGDAEAWHRLGQEFEYNLDELDFAKAIEYNERAVKLGPRSADDWIDLANAYEAEGDTTEANAAYANARQNYPISANVAWQYGNFLLRQGQAEQGLAEIHQAILTDPVLTSLAIPVVWQLSPDVHLLLNRVLPADRGAEWQALDFFADQRDADAGLTTWEYLLANAKGKPLELKRVFPFLDQLMAQGREEDVERVWSEALAASRWHEAPPGNHSLIWNGEFQGEPANGGLDWRMEETPGAIVSFDSRVKHSGARSLRVDFTGGMNLDYAGVHELVPVKAGQEYQFQAFLRTQDITTESGMRFEIVDPQHPQAGNFLTPGLTGTNPWTAENVTVKTSPETHYVDVRLRRFPSRLFDSKLAGTVWVDDVTLVPSAPAAKKNQP